VKHRIFFAAGVLIALAPAYGQKPAEASGAQKVITGRPFSATEERHSLQVLADGTRIETRQTNRLYRDGDGRTRVEEMNGIVTLLDPAIKISVTLDPAVKQILNKKAAVVPLLAEQQEADLKKIALTSRRVSSLTETFAPQAMGGVLARGLRSTTTIPAGAIGNDRPINIVTERWFSDELQIMVKSSNSDPRFGDTTYEVTGIVQGPQDPALFQIPADYTVAPDTSLLDRFKAKKQAAEAEQRLQKNQQQK
jgi:hypothetical protein